MSEDAHKIDVMKATPRTDEAWNNRHNYTCQTGDFAMANFARTLELENQELKEEVKRLHKELVAANKGAQTNALVNQELAKRNVEFLEQRNRALEVAKELAKVVNSFRWLAVNSANHKFPEYKEMIDDLGRIADKDAERFNTMIKEIER